MEDLINKIILGDCLEVMKKIPNKSVDLIIADPPYEILNTNAGGNSGLTKSLQSFNDDLVKDSLHINLGIEWCKEVPRLQKNINCYIWCNKAQILQYVQYFVVELGCNWDILNWQKTNAIPTFNNKYLTDKEYCLYFRKGGYCNPQSYEDGKTIFYEPINIKDKNKYQHPTIKPEKIIRTLVRNSSKENQLILDPFGGSGTTAVCAYKENRNFILIEKNKNHWINSNNRINELKAQLTLFA